MNRMPAAVALLVVSGVLFAAPPGVSTPVTPAQLAEQLGSDVYDEREAAMVALGKLGEVARPALELAAKSPNPETGKRAIQLLNALQRATDGADRLKVKTIKLGYKNTPLGTAVNDFKARTGIPVMLDTNQIADPLRLVSCETGDLPPWEALATLCQSANLREAFDVELPMPKQERTRRGYVQSPPPAPLPEAVPVKLIDGAGPAPVGSRNTAVRVLALPANFSKHRVYLGGGEMLFHFDVAPMAGYHFQNVAGVRISKVVDDSNRVGAAGTNREPAGFINEFLDGFAFGPGGGIAIGWDGDMPVRPTSYPNPRIVPVHLRLGTTNARKLKLLEGAVLCEISVPNQPLVTIDNVAASVGQGVDGLRGTKLTVVEAKPPLGKGGKAVLKVQLDQPPAWLTSNRFGFGGNPWGGLMVVDSMEAEPSNPNHTLKGYDAAGKPVRLTTITNSSSSNDEFTISTVTQYACPDGLPAKIVLHGPKPVMVEVPFKMENVPLP